MRARILAGVLLLFWGVGCVEIDGGAVEISWALFARDGRGITDCSCGNPTISSVRLNLVSAADPAVQPCAGLATCRFSCDRKTGATPFLVPPGQYLMSIIPTDAAGNDLPTVFSPSNPMPWVQTPAATSRTVVRGQPTALEAFGLEVDCQASCGSGDIFTPCTAN